MGRRNDIDWERIERDYSAGQLTIRQIADEHGVSDSQVRAKAKKEGWRRDLSDAIAARTKAKISALDVSALIEETAKESAQKSAEALRRAVEQASDIASGTVLRHRADIRLDMERAQAISALLDDKLSEAECLADVVRATQAFKALVDARSKLIDKEREAFGIESGDKGGDDRDLNIEVKFV